MFLIKMTEIIDRIFTLLKASKDKYFFKIQARMKYIYLTIGHNIHFWIKKIALLAVNSK